MTGPVRRRRRYRQRARGREQAFRQYGLPHSPDPSEPDWEDEFYPPSVTERYPERLSVRISDVEFHLLEGRPPDSLGRSADGPGMDSPRDGYLTAMVTPAWLSTPPTVTTTGTAEPVGAVFGTVTFN